MPHILSTRGDKLHMLQIMQQLVEKFIPMKPEQRAQLSEHFAHLRQVNADFDIACRFETIPEFQSTRLLLDLSYTGNESIPPIRQ